MTPPSKIPYLHVRSVDGFLFEGAVAVTGNRKALLQLRAQIDRALEGGGFLYDETIYHNVHGQEYEVVVNLARSPEEMREPVPMPDKTPEELPWAKLAWGPGEQDR